MKDTIVLYHKKTHFKIDLAVMFISGIIIIIIF